MLIDSPRRTTPSWASGLQGPSRGDAVSTESSRDKRPKRSLRETHYLHGRAISALRTNDLDLVALVCSACSGSMAGGVIRPLPQPSTASND